MLPSNQRLTRQQVTDLLENKGLKVIFNRTGTLKYLCQSNSGTLKDGRFTVVTGSKHQKKAVLRNKVRRQIYSSIKQYKGILPISGIFYVSKQIYGLSFAEVKANFHALLQKTA